jgi:hypothetical protein
MVTIMKGEDDEQCEYDLVGSVERLIGIRSCKTRPALKRPENII